MKSIKTNIVVSLFMLFLAICIIGTSVIILRTPVEITSGTAGNYTVNLANGGFVIEDNGFLFFSSPFAKGIFRTETSKFKDSVKINDEGDGYLQRVDSSYFYSENNSLRRCDVDGEGKRTILKFAKKPLVVGGTVFYLDINDNLCKYSFQTEKSKIIVKSNKSKIKEFVVYYKKIYYTDEKGNINKISYDGSDNEVFLSANASKISIDGQYIFYIENGELYSAMLSDKKMVKAKIISVKQYAVYEDNMIFFNDTKVYQANINDIVKNGNKAKINKVYEGKVDGISIDENYFYFFSDNNELIRIPHDSTNQQKILMKGGK